LFIVLGVRSIATLLTYSVRLGLQQTQADRGWVSNIIFSLTPPLFWASVFAYRVSLTGLYVLLDRGRTKISIKSIAISYSVILFLYSSTFVLGSIFNLVNIIDRYTWQIWFFASVIAMVVAGSPLWLILPLRMLHQIRSRKFKTGRGPRAGGNTEFLVKKLRAGLGIQITSAILSIIVSTLALAVPYLQQNATIMFHLIVFLAAANAFMQFFVFGGLSVGKYAHSSYYKETDGKATSGNASSVDIYPSSHAEKTESKFNKDNDAAAPEKLSPSPSVADLSKPKEPTEVPIHVQQPQIE